MIRNIQYLRGIAAIAVVFFHMRLYEGKSTSGMGILPNGFACGDAGVDLFFVISGFIMVYIQPGRISSPSQLIRFLAHRFTRIYPPYWFISTGLLFIWMIKPTLFNSFYHNNVDIVKSFFLLPQDYTPLLGVGWTLIHEVYFYLIVSIALLFGFRGRVLFGILWFFLVFGIFGLFGHSRFNGNCFLQLIFSPFSMTFLLGYFLGLLYPYIRRIKSLTLAFILGLGVVGLIIGSLYIPSVGVYPNNNHLFRFAAYGVPCFFIVASCIGLERDDSRSNVILKVLGDASYATYLVHLPIIALFYAVIKHYQIRDAFILSITAMLCFVTCLGASILFNRRIENPTLRFTRRFIEKTYGRSQAGKGS